MAARNPGNVECSNLDHNMDKGEEDRVEKAAGARRGKWERNKVRRDRIEYSERLLRRGGKRGVKDEEKMVSLKEEMACIQILSPTLEYHRPR